MASSASTFKTLSLAVPLAGVAMFPDEAEACSVDACYYADAWSAIEPLNAAAIPIDGVLLLQGTESGDLTDAEWITRIDLTVTRDGETVAGALETSTIDDIVIWRPAEPLAPGATFKVTGTLDNPDMPEYYDCWPDLLAIDFEFSSDMTPSTPLVAPDVGATEEVIVNPHLGLEDLVCCDDAFPFRSDDYCGGGGYTDWSSGFCATLHGRGVLRVQLTLDHALPDPTAAMVTRQVLTDGEEGQVLRTDELVATGDQPICTEVVLRNLATGESVTTPKQCHGDAVAAQLGLQDLDPSALLAEKCAGVPYVCELNVDGDAWNRDDCTPWPPVEPTGGPETTGDATTGDTDDGDDTEDGSDSAGQDDPVDRGCNCASGPPDGLGLLAVAGLGLLRRRRRA